MKIFYYRSEFLELIDELVVDAIGQVVYDPEKFPLNDQALMVRGIMFLRSELEEKLMEGDKDESADD